MTARTPKASSKPSTTSQTDQVRVVYGITKAINIGIGARADMERYVALMNAQAPQYNHRIEEL